MRLPLCLEGLEKEKEISVIEQTRSAHLLRAMNSDWRQSYLNSLGKILALPTLAVCQTVYVSDGHREVREPQCGGRSRRGGLSGAQEPPRNLMQ